MSNFYGWRAPGSHATAYVQSIQEILTKDPSLKLFRKNINSGYSKILEHLSQAEGQRYYSEILRQFSSHEQLIEKFKINDTVGQPPVYPYGANMLNPTTMRYSFVAMDILNSFGSLDGLHYVEIGAGYGGQINALSTINNFKSIKLFDIPEALQLQKVYLNKFNIDPQIYVIDEDFDIEEDSIVVSNYAWCELDRQFRDIYKDKIINKCKLAYLTVYDIDLENEIADLNGNVTVAKDNFNGSYIIKVKN